MWIKMKLNDFCNQFIDETKSLLTIFAVGPISRVFKVMTKVVH